MFIKVGFSYKQAVGNGHLWPKVKHWVLNFPDPLGFYAFIYMTFLRLARTVYMHRIWPYIQWFPCQKYRIYTVYIWFWPTLEILYLPSDKECSVIQAASTRHCSSQVSCEYRCTKGVPSRRRKKGRLIRAFIPRHCSSQVSQELRLM
jgi:hypothetical protein